MTADRPIQPPDRVRRGRGMLLAAGLAVVVVAAVVLATRGADDGDEQPAVDTSSPTMPAETTRPTEIAASTSDGRVVLLSAEDGRVLRVLARGLESRAAVAVTPDGATVYFSSSSQTRELTHRCDPAVLESIGADGGGRNLVAHGVNPAVSPDGRRLAYLRGPGSPACPQAIVVRDLRTRDERDWAVSKREGVSILSWAPDSRHLLVVSDDDDDGAGPLLNRLLNTHAGDSLSDAPSIVSRHPAAVILGELGDTNTLASEGDNHEDPSIARGRLVALEPETGDKARTVYEFPSQSWGDPDFLPRPAYDDRRFASDRSGRHLLWIASWKRFNVLYRFSEGDVEPTELGDGILDAAWVPGTGASDASNARG